MTAWYEAHQELMTFLCLWTGPIEARSIASAACGWWVERAAEGEQPEPGPYAALYASALAVLNQRGTAEGSIRSEVAVSHIPINASMLPYQLSKIHTDIWKAAQLLGWNRTTVRRVAKGLVRTRPVMAGGWAEMGSAPLGNLVPPLVRRAVAVLSEHQCVDCRICGEHAVRWENADRRTEEWFTGARLKKEEERCQTEGKSPSA
jgi:hypothetical protein